MRNYVQRGDNITVPAAPRDLESGEGCQIGQLFGAASAPADEGDEVVLVCTGVIDLGKDTVAADLGDAIYWDDTIHSATTSSSGGKLRIGVCVQDAGAEAGSLYVRLG